MPSTEPHPIENDPRWAAVIAHDRSQDGRFVYSVATTGVYCRPSCGARRPRPENVGFHADAAVARAAGFRACKRCRPDEGRDRQGEAVAAACRAIETAETPPSLDELASVTGLSPHHFHRVFKAATGVTPRQYAAGRRAERVRKALGREETVTAAVFDAGFNSSGRFYANAPQALGMSPRAWRDGGRGERITFAVGETSLGSVLAARSQQGVCAILMGDDPDALVRDLQDRFPRAELTAGDREFDATLARVAAMVERPERGLDLPLDVRGTAFQQRVWRALQAIPPGETANYSALAQRLGEPKAVRAVAGACAANPLAIAVPCHRVVRLDGDLSGYRWGVERKRALLDREAQAA